MFVVFAVLVMFDICNVCRRGMMADPVHIKAILPGVFHGIRHRYHQNFAPDGRAVLQDLRAQIREKGIGRYSRSPVIHDRQDR